MTPSEFRRRLHADPELSFREERTARFIGETLTAEGIEWRRVAGTGVLARIKGRGDLRKAVVLRADIDALPIREEVDSPWRSKNEGVMHACGHDIHAAALFGALQRLHASRDFEGTLFGLFQPAEECNPGGAQAVIADRPFEGYDVQAVIGSHVEAGMAVGTFGFCAGQFMASNDEIRITVRGRGGHAAMRSQIVDPVVASGALLLALHELNSGDVVLSTGKVAADGATNVIPDTVHIEGTMRTFDETLRADVKVRIGDITREVDDTWGTQTSVKYTEGYPCVVNDPALTAAARDLAAEHYAAADLPRRTTSEDFGRYGLLWPSLFYRFGVGETSGATHTSRFNPDERAIDTAADFASLLVNKITSTR